MRAGKALTERIEQLPTRRLKRSNALKFAETLIQQKTATYCSELQRQILIGALQDERKTYDQLAIECGYSAKYVKQDVAPKLWQLLSQVLGTKVTKANARAVLEHAIAQKQQAAAQSTAATDALDIGVLETDEMETDDPEGIGVSIQKGTILLVDDQPQNLRLLSDLLEEQGYEVQQAINGTIALQAIARQQPDLVLLDITMPDVDGYSVCQQLKANRKTQDIPVIFVSALDEAWDKVKAFTVGGSDYISKPFKVVEVLARVENQLKIKQLQSTLQHRNRQLRQAIQELQRLAAIDKLTRVASRRRFDAYLLECWEQAIVEQQPLTLMFIQLNHFDIYREGADAGEGDRTLQQLAQLIQDTVLTPQSLTSRYGTLTFAILVPQRHIPQNQAAQPQPESDDAPATSPEAIAQKLLRQIQNGKTSATKSITTHIGLATVKPTVHTQLEDFLAKGDQALQQAKQQKENCIVALTL